MQTEQKAAETPAKKNKGGRPAGYSPVKVEAKPVTLIEEDGEYVLIRVQKKQLAKLLLKDLI